MGASTYSLEDERVLNTHLRKILDVLHVHIPDDHFGTVELFFPRQNGKLSGKVEVKLSLTHLRERDRL